MCLRRSRRDIKNFNDLNVLLTSKSRQARLIKKNKEDKQIRNDVSVYRSSTTINDLRACTQVQNHQADVLVDNMLTYILAASFTFLQIFAVGLQVLSGREREREMKMGYAGRSAHHGLSQVALQNTDFAQVVIDGWGGGVPPD